MSKCHDEVLGVDDDGVDVWIATRRRSWIVRSVAAISLVAGLAGVVVALMFKVRYDAISSRTGDLKTIEARIGALKTEQTARGTDLDLLRRSIAQSRNEMAIARHQAQRAQCEAENARIDAEVIVQQVSCYKAVADYYLCDAKNSKAKADDSMLGALIGAGLAIATGGSALLAVGGAALGSAGSGNNVCPAVQCELDPAVIESSALAKHGRPRRTSCADAGRT